MEIKAGHYRCKNQQIVVIERKQDYPVPGWIGRIVGREGEYQWDNQGQEVSGHMPWNLVERIQEEENNVRWNLQCIPTELDQFVRHRQIEEGKKFLCQQVVADLQAYYKILAAKELMGG